MDNETNNHQFDESTYVVDVSNSVVKVVVAPDWEGHTIFRIFLEDELGSEPEDVETDSDERDEFIKAVRLIQDRYRGDIPFVVPDFDTDATTLLKQMGGVNVKSTEGYMASRSR